MGYSRKYKRTNKLKRTDFMEDAKRQAVVNPIKITDELIIKYLISALFPTAYKNFEQGMSDQYTRGYIQGREDAEYERTHPKRD